MDSQPKFPLEFPRQADSVNPRLQFAKFRAGKKIIQIPYSIWKDGRMRADLSKYGAREVVSRNSANLQDRVIERLREHFGAIVEAVYHEFSRAGRPKAATPRSSNKLAAMPQSSAAIRYINPFTEKWTFEKCPDWLSTKRESTAIEKHIYGKLLYPALVCQRWDQTTGVIFGLNQAKLAKALGLPRQSVNVAITSLRCRRPIECNRPPRRTARCALLMA